jgi:hypothetical protein
VLENGSRPGAGCILLGNRSENSFINSTRNFVV